MSTTTFYSFSALAAIVAGLSIILGALLTDLLKTKKGTVFNFLGALVGLFGITGIYLWQANQAGIFGLVAYVVVFIGLALVACVDYSGAFVTPSLSEDELSRLGDSVAMKATYISFFIFLIGEILFGISTIMAGVFSLLASVLFMVGFLGTIFRPVNQVITFVGLTLSGTGLIWWGVSLWLMAGNT